MTKPLYRDYKHIGHGAFGKSPHTPISLCLSLLTFRLNLGHVFKAIDDHTKQPVAIKRSQKVGNKVSREYEILSALNGKPNVIRLLNFFYTVDSKQRLI